MLYIHNAFCTMICSLGLSAKTSFQLQPREVQKTSFKSQYIVEPSARTVLIDDYVG
jgi:hypothetical protein